MKPDSNKYPFIVFIPSLVAVLLAATHLVLILMFDLGPWRGANFGMFSDISNTVDRQVAVFLETEGVPESIEIPANMKLRLEEFPAPFRLESTLQLLLCNLPQYGETLVLEYWESQFVPDNVSLHMENEWRGKGIVGIDCNQ